MKKRTYHTDGACLNNGTDDAKAAWAYCCVQDKCEGSGAVEGKQSNNTAELTAIIEAMKHAKREKVTHIIVFSDSQYAIKCIVGEWARKKNGEFFDRIDKLAEAFSMVHFEWVRGHNGDPANERADELCRAFLKCRPRNPKYSFKI